MSLFKKTKSLHNEYTEMCLTIESFSNFNSIFFIILQGGYKISL